MMGPGMESWYPGPLAKHPKSAKIKENMSQTVYQVLSTTILHNRCIIILAQLAGAVEYTDCITAEG